MDGIGWQYSDIVKDHFMNPRNVLMMPETEYKADGVGYVGSPACGDMMKLWIKVDKETLKIKECKWKTFGCASAIASTSMLSIMVTEDEGMHIQEAFKITPDDIMKRLGGLPAHKIHCSVLGDKALREAIKEFVKNNNIPGDYFEKAAFIICKCLGVTDKEIEEQVLEGVKDFETLQERTKVSTGCGQCKDEVRALLAGYIKKYYNEDLKI